MAGDKAAPAGRTLTISADPRYPFFHETELSFQAQWGKVKIVSGVAGLDHRQGLGRGIVEPEVAEHLVKRKNEADFGLDGQAAGLRNPAYAIGRVQFKGHRGVVLHNGMILKLFQVR